MKGRPSKRTPFSVEIEPDYRGLLACLRRGGTPQRVHFYELYLDAEIRDLLCDRYGLVESLDPGDPCFSLGKEIALQRFLGYDTVLCPLDGFDLPLRREAADDTSAVKREGGREFIDEHRGPISSWEEFEAYPWPDPRKASTRSLEWYTENLPDDMCIVARGVARFSEHLMMLMGYETLCFALFEQRDLVEALSRRLIDIYRGVIDRFLEFDRVEIVLAADDMGFRSGTLISPDDLRALVLPGHSLVAQAAHRAERIYVLHSCGDLSAVMDDLIDGVGIDAKHSFEDTIESVVDAKWKYGDRIALLGGIDVNFLCTADERRIRERVRDTLSACLPGGGYCLGTGNSVANYIPINSYLAMLDEGRKFRL